MPHPNWAFAGYEFPLEDSPPRGSSGDWDLEEKLVEHDPLNADVTILTSWGMKSGRRTIAGVCGQTTRDQMRTFHDTGTIGTLRDGENRTRSARIVKASFITQIPNLRYIYTLEFVER